MVQYIKMFGQQQGKSGTDYRRKMMVTHVPASVRESDSSCKILGLQIIQFTKIFILFPAQYLLDARHNYILHLTEKSPNYHWQFYR